MTKRPNRKEYNRELHARRWAEDPEYREACRARWRRRYHEKYPNDPEYRQKAKDRAARYVAKNGRPKRKPTGAVKIRQCEECGHTFTGVGRKCGTCP